MSVTMSWLVYEVLMLLGLSFGLWDGVRSPVPAINNASLRVWYKARNLFIGLFEGLLIDALTSSVALGAFGLYYS